MLHLTSLFLDIDQKRQRLPFRTKALFEFTTVCQYLALITEHSPCNARFISSNLVILMSGRVQSTRPLIHNRSSASCHAALHLVNECHFYSPTISVEVRVCMKMRRFAFTSLTEEGGVWYCINKDSVVGAMRTDLSPPMPRKCHLN